jgi:hypothetical protein
MSDPAPNFRNTRKFLGPSWLTSAGESELVGWVVDVLKDAFTERLRQGLLARFPQQGPDGSPAADDALAAIGRDRRIVRGMSETSPAYAARLLKWLDDWRQAGNAFALMRKLSEYTGPGPMFRTVDNSGNWYTRAVDGTQTALLSQTNWNWDGATDPQYLNRWSRFWVIIYPNGLWTVGPKWGDAGVKWGAAGRTWGTTATVDQVGAVRGIVSDWKPAGTKCVNIIIAFDNTSFDPTKPYPDAGLPDSNWERYEKVSGNTRVASRLSTARYWAGV